MKKYIFKKYNKNYKKLFENEKNKLFNLLPDCKIEHIGSTSVNGLGGKGIIDILVIVSKNKLKKFEKLLLNNYCLMGIPENSRISFKNEKVHIHLTFLNSKTYRNMIKFRENLRNNSNLVKKYENLKKKACNIANDDGRVYRSLKEDFIIKHSK